MHEGRDDDEEEAKGKECVRVQAIEGAFALSDGVEEFLSEATYVFITSSFIFPHTKRRWAGGFTRAGNGEFCSVGVD